MPESKLQVKLLTGTPNPVSLIYAAFRQCYSPGFAGDLWPRLVNGDVSRDEQAGFIAKVLESGHDSPIEHVSYSFAVQGVSRALTHQLVRHRIASYSQQSQRYVDESGFEYVLPPAIARIPEARKRYEDFMSMTGQAYRDLKAILQEHGRGKKANEDARFVLPQAAESKIVITMNCRSLIHFFELRCCERAQWEIRKMAWKMLKLLSTELPVIFQLAGPRCRRLGYCPEGEKFTCGKMPLQP
ncbi:FAD-dependent thymidylate synthase [Desulfonatronovibrio hydrogenovorans]|uniref:FAD-dependent thymidylate synthase n=1 Tax=Desulfonatronovibrio hydrogenovorans TaxID=53245 RepID=UPI00048BAA21|nr:FAD-dependent thymidylate synthase [Desulfonatronovibrio hydrogenovorans]